MLDSFNVQREIATEAVRDYLLMKYGRSPSQEQIMAEFGERAIKARTAVEGEKRRREALVAA